MRRPLSRTHVLRAVAVAVVTLVAVFVAVRASSGTARPAATVSTDATAWRLPRLGGGGDISLAGLRGRPLVVDFFATWCTACEGELPGFAAVSRQLQGRVTFAGVDSQENGDGMAMARRFGIGWWPLAVDSGGTQDSGLHDALGARGMPVTAFYDAAGHVLRVVPGAVSEADLRTLLNTLYGVGA